MTTHNGSHYSRSRRDVPRPHPRHEGSTVRPYSPSRHSRANTANHDAHTAPHSGASQQTPDYQHFETLNGNTALQSYSYQKRPRQQGRPTKKKTSPRVVIILVAVLIVIVAGGIFAWMHRPVEIFVNDSRRTYNVGTTLEAIYNDEGLQEDAGNFVSVSGNVLEEGKGDPWSVKVNDNEISYNDATGYKINGAEKISFDTGKDRTEDFDVTEQEVQPKMRFEGTWGNVTYVSQWGKVERKEVLTGKVSGETCDGDILEEGQDCVITTKNVEPADGQKLVALTFDDGPSDYTERYLEILKEHDAVGTFFLLGENVESYPELAKKIADSGSQICSHTQSHQQLNAISADATLSEITTAFTEIENASGVKTTTMRPPYGAIDSSVWLASQGAMSASVIWNMDSLDWKRPGVDTIVSNSTEGIQSGYIILMHDGGGNRDQDLEALPKIIDKLHEEGYTFVTVSDLMKSDPDIPSDVASCNAPMPEDAVWPTELSSEA